MSEAEGERLQKVLARVGYGSRRTCELLIADGRVTVNGDVAVLGRRVEAGKDLVEVDGAPVGILPGLVYYLLNKPIGVVTTADDPEGRPTVLELVPAEPRVFSVGRLDRQTEGLLVLTNDGELAQLLAHPRFGVEKEYLAEVTGVPGPAAIRRLREGVVLDDGETTAPARVAAVSPGLLRLVIHEGRQPAGAPDVRGRRPSCRPARPDPDRAGQRPVAPPRHVATARALRSAIAHAGRPSPVVEPVGRLPAHGRRPPRAPRSDHSR